MEWFKITFYSFPIFLSCFVQASTPYAWLQFVSRQVAACLGLAFFAATGNTSRLKGSKKTWLMCIPGRDSLSSRESLKTRVVFRHSPLLFHVSGRLASGSCVLILSHTVNENTLALGQQWNLGTHVLNPQVGSKDTYQFLTFKNCISFLQASGSNTAFGAEPGTFGAANGKKRCAVVVENSKIWRFESACYRIWR